MLGSSRLSYQSRPLGALAERAGQVAGEQRDAEEDQHADLAMPHMDTSSAALSSPSQPGSTWR